MKYILFNNYKHGEDAKLWRHTRQIWHTPTQNLFHLKTQSVRRSKHSASRLQTPYQLIMYKEKLVCSEIHKNT
jgi:hypothetical protein